MKLILTNIGEAKLAQSLVNPNEPLVFSKMVIGDYNGDTTSQVDKTNIMLVNEKYRGVLNSKKYVNGQLEVMMVLPTTTGGYMVREVGLIDDDDQLIAIGRYPETYKTMMSEGPSIIDIYVVLTLSNSENTEVTFSNDNVYVYNSVFNTTVDYLKNRTINNLSFNNQTNLDLEDRIGTSITASPTTKIGTVGAGESVYVLGNNTITSFGSSQTGVRRTMIFTGVCTITHNATTLLLPTNANIVTAIGDIMEVVCIDGLLSKWICITYLRKDGTPLSLGALNTNGNSATTTKFATGRNLAYNGDVVTTSKVIDGTTDLTYTLNLIPANVLDRLKGVDGSGSGLDADMLDGRHAADLLFKDNLTVYSPTNQYHPATKKYVDEVATTGGGNVEITRIVKYVATSNQTVFAADYLTGSITVTLNGLELDSDLDYSALNGTTVTLLSPAVAGDIIRITIYGGADVYNKTQTNAFLATKIDKVTSTDNAIVRYNGSAGSVQNSLAIIDDVGNVSVPPGKAFYGALVGNASTATKLATPVNISGIPFDGTSSITIFVTGMIMLWSGSIASVPTGWYLCNGANGTPNLTNRFVMGAGSSYAVGATGGTADSVVVSHSHTASADSQGYHAHTASTDSQGSHGHTAWTDSQGAHTHGYNRAEGYSGGLSSYIGNGSPNNATAKHYVDTAGDHGHNVGIGAAGAHAHNITVNANGAHAHNITVAANGVSGTNMNLPPYYALCYIMKS